MTNQKHGVVVVDKPSGMTSHDVVFKMRKVLKTKRVGHTGTLDPDVTGVLPIVVGDATKLTEILQMRDKRYSATVTLGIATDTEDASGNVTARQTVDENISIDEVNEALQSFIGGYSQMVPMYSSVRVNGRKLYEYARNGEQVERPVKDIYIEDIKLTSDIKKDSGTLSFDIDVKCSKGTYIRTLAVDIGKALGYPAHMSYLRRTASCGFSLDDATPLQDLIENPEAVNVIPVIEILDDQVHFDISDDQALQFKITNGQKLVKSDILNVLGLTELDTVLFTHQNVPIGIYKTHVDKPDQLKPFKMFSNLWGTYGNI